MSQDENDTVEVPSADRIRAFARRALDIENECQPMDDTDRERREILAVLARVGPVSPGFVADAHLAIRDMVSDQVEHLGFAGEGLAPLLYELYAWCDEEAALTFEGGKWVTLEEAIGHRFGPEAVAAFRAVQAVRCAKPAV
jgi:hypothetical protein